MAASDYVPIFFKNRLHLTGGPQMSTRASGLWTSGAYLQHENSQLSPIPLARKRIPAPSLARRGAIWRGVAP